jgi:hypothetical protein
MLSTRRSRVVLTLALAIVLLLVFAGTALAQTPANDGWGQSFGQHHAACAQMGMLGKDMNPGTHLGLAGWEGTCPGM